MKIDYTKLIQATHKDIIIGNGIFIEGDDKEMHYKIIKEVLKPDDAFKAFVADDGCRYGLDGAFILE